MNNQLKEDHYVYGLYDKFGVIKYIGSGRGLRKLDKSGRSDEFISILNDEGNIQPILENISRSEAVRVENELLSLYRHQIININKKVRLLEYNFEYFNKFLYLSDDSPTLLRWKISPSRKCRINGIAGRYIKGYCVVTISRNIYQVHRILYCLRNKCNLHPHEVINHIDHNPSNNLESNLERVSYSVNCIKRFGYKSEDRGIKLRDNSFTAQIFFNHKQYYCTFSTKDFGFYEAGVKARDCRQLMIAIISNQISDEEKLSHLINIPNIKVSKKLNVIDGIRYRSGKRNCFEVYVMIDGKQKTKHFSINKYGYEEAKRLAEEAKIVLQTLIN